MRKNPLELSDQGATSDGLNTVNLSSNELRVEQGMVMALPAGRRRGSTALDAIKQGHRQQASVLFKKFSTSYFSYILNYSKGWLLGASTILFSMLSRDVIKNWVVEDTTENELLAIWLLMSSAALFQASVRSAPSETLNTYVDFFKYQLFYYRFVLLFLVTPRLCPSPPSKEIIINCSAMNMARDIHSAIELGLAWADSAHFSIKKHVAKVPLAIQKLREINLSRSSKSAIVIEMEEKSGSEMGGRAVSCENKREATVVDDEKAISQISKDDNSPSWFNLVCTFVSKNKMWISLEAIITLLMLILPRQVSPEDDDGVIFSMESMAILNIGILAGNFLINRPFYWWVGVPDENANAIENNKLADKTQVVEAEASTLQKVLYPILKVHDASHLWLGFFLRTGHAAGVLYAGLCLGWKNENNQREFIEKSSNPENLNADASQGLDRKQKRLFVVRESLINGLVLSLVPIAIFALDNPYLAARVAAAVFGYFSTYIATIIMNHKDSKIMLPYDELTIASLVSFFNTEYFGYLSKDAASFDTHFSSGMIALYIGSLWGIDRAHATPWGKPRLKFNNALGENTRVTRNLMSIIFSSRLFIGSQFSVDPMQDAGMAAGASTNSTNCC